VAGDWIKIEHVTPDKPEVHRMAEALGIDPDAVVGKLLRLWIWADQQTYFGDALSVTLSSLDRICFVTGFAQALVNVGWLTCENGLVRFTNFDRHNGNTAKTRAGTMKRMQRKRDADSVTKPSPEKRKRRDNTPLPPLPSSIRAGRRPVWLVSAASFRAAIRGLEGRACGQYLLFCRSRFTPVRPHVGGTGSSTRARQPPAGQRALSLRLAAS